MNQLTTDKAAKPLKKLPMRLHHHAYTTDNHERTRHFYEDVVGLPLAIMHLERELIRGEWVDLGHAFYELGDGSTLAFFSFADPEKQAAWKAKECSLFIHISLLVERSTQNEIERRLTDAGFEPFTLVHGLCTSLYVKDPNGLMVEFTVDHDDASDIAREMATSLRQWLEGERNAPRRWRSEIVASIDG
jgi:catechol 2,3-dioxygenase-like lactoylglutathione lyase family enzyme